MPIWANRIGVGSIPYNRHSLSYLIFHNTLRRLKMSKYTNMVGNPVDGFKCYGIFDDLQDAIDWQDGCDESCWVVELETDNS